MLAEYGRYRETEKTFKIVFEKKRLWRYLVLKQTTNIK